MKTPRLRTAPYSLPSTASAGAFGDAVQRTAPFAASSATPSTAGESLSREPALVYCAYTRPSPTAGSPNTTSPALSGAAYVHSADPSPR
ncbi:hypothetical protein [Streptomyces sp. NPDC057748]|uniref:hypothetical protein n=1 Tax=unclassified Streptomyces TaxID=2593676 RepID=UPI0036C458D8